MDGIDYFTISKLPIKYKLTLNDIYNKMLCFDVWKYVFVHLIKKPDNSGLCSIAVTQYLYKIMEIMMKNRLQWWCEHKSGISSDQTGFRNSRSCVDNVLDLTL